MLTITERAASELQAVRATNDASPDQGVRLTPDGKGGIGLTIDAPSEGDEVIRHEETPLVIVDGRIAPLLDGAELDCKTDVDSPVDGQPRTHFTLRPAV